MSTFTSIAVAVTTMLATAPALAGGGSRPQAHGAQIHQRWLWLPGLVAVHCLPGQRAVRHPALGVCPAEVGQTPYAKPPARRWK